MQVEFIHPTRQRVVHCDDLPDEMDGNIEKIRTALGLIANAVDACSYRSLYAVVHGAFGDNEFVVERPAFGIVEVSRV